MLTDLARRAEMVMAEVSASSRTVLRIGNGEWTPPTLQGAIQSSLLPAVEVRTETVDPVTAVHAVSQGKLTAALVPNVKTDAAFDAAETELARVVIVREPVWLALPNGHRLLEENVVSTAQLASLRWVRYAREHWFHHIEDELLRSRCRGEGPKVLHIVRSHHEAMSWVRDVGAAALTTPTGSTRDVSLVPMTQQCSTELQLVWRKGAISEHVLAELTESVRRYYTEYARTIPRYWDWMIEHPADFSELSMFLPRSVRTGEESPLAGPRRITPSACAPAASPAVSPRSA